MSGSPVEIETLFRDRAREFVDGYSYDFLGPRFRNAIENLCRSPIEQRMLVELVFAEWGYASCLEVFIPGQPLESSDEAVITLSCQHGIGPYSIDIAVVARRRDGTTLTIAVECDGHDFHERTKEQASNDKKRDRDLQMAGVMVFRYSGSDIFRRGRSCAAEVANFVFQNIG